MAKNKIKKRDSGLIENTSIHKTNHHDDLIKFSFHHFTDNNNKFGYPCASIINKYLPILLNRLKDVSNYKLSEFRNKKCQTLRNHAHEWSETSEPDGYNHLNEQLRQCEPWQFCLTANEYGRVHGILIGEVFYIIWLDVNHSLYPNKNK